MSLRLLALGALVTLSVSCGTPFVDGWRDKNHPERTGQDSCIGNAKWDEARGCVTDGNVDFGLVPTEKACNATGQSIWVDGDCKAISEVSEDVCAKVAGWSWVHGKCTSQAETQCLADPAKVWANDACVAKPALDVAGGDLTQAIAAGIAMTPIDLKPAGGATVKIANATGCPDFLKMSGNQLVSGDRYKAPADGSVCELDLIPVAGTVEGDARHVKVSIERGFYSICSGRATPEENNAFLAVQKKVQKVHCDEAMDELVKQTILDMDGFVLKDLGVFRGLKALTRLDLTGSDITDVGPLAGLTNLVTLVLSYNTHLIDVSPLVGARALEKVMLDGTPLEKSRTEATCPTAPGVPSGLAWACER